MAERAAELQDSADERGWITLEDDAGAFAAPADLVNLCFGMLDCREWYDVRTAFASGDGADDEADLGR